MRMLAFWARTQPERDPALIVARAWRQVLDEQSLSTDMPFGEAGGDSLQLLKLIFLIEERGSQAADGAVPHRLDTE